MRVTGLEVLRRELPRELRAAAAAAVKESGAAMTADVQRNVRRDTGNLRESVAAAYDRDGLRTSVGWRDQDDKYALFHERGTRRIPANPTLLPALERESRELVDRLRTEIRRRL